jgi:glutamyl-tRNA reductase
MRVASTVHVVGTNHKHTALADRERLAVGEESPQDLLERARAALGARECVVLRTCNRVEVYFLASPAGYSEQAAAEMFTGICDPSTSSPASVIYHYASEDAATHLFEVACGLDSMILGEHEILGQVKSALSEAAQTGDAGPILTRLFNRAIRAGKRARSETAISSGIFSVGQCAARLAQQVLGELNGKRLLVLGAGRIAKVTAKHMVALGAGPAAVLSRTRERAEELAAMLDGEVVTAEELPQNLRACDILAGCASAPHHVVGCAEIERAMGDRIGRPLVVIDLGMPRNVDPEVGELPGVRLFNLDHLGAVVAENIGAREAEIERVKAIVTEEIAASRRVEAEAEAAAVIAKLRGKAEALRQECLALVDRRKLSDEDRACFDYLTDLLVRKLLHKPVVTLREAGCDAATEDVELAAAVTKLFDLHEETDHNSESGHDGEPATAAAVNKDRRTRDS